MREEGEWWVAYYAKPDTMDNAIEIGRCPMAGAAHRPEYRTRFIELMRDIISDYLEGIAGSGHLSLL